MAPKGAKLGYCRICWLPAIGIHYGALACAGCKSFFRRAMLRKPSYLCQTGTGQCREEAKCCKGCRLRKCLDVGMKMESKDGLDRASIHPAKKKSDKKCQNTLIHTADDGVRNIEQVQRTTQSLSGVVSAVDAAFGDQLDRWPIPRNCRPETGPSTESVMKEVAAVLRQHRGDFAERLKTFGERLSAYHALYPKPDHRDIGTKWKIIACAMIHHAPFMAANDVVVVDVVAEEKGEVKLEECYEELHDPLTAVMVRSLSRRFWTSLHSVGLRQVERYLLIATILFEPVDDYKAESTPSLSALHHYYTDLLVNVIKERCFNRQQFSLICAKLENFFCALEEVDALSGILALSTCIHRPL